MKRFRYMVLFINLVIILRLFFICIINHNYYQYLYNKLDNNVFYGDSAPRGRILDCKGNILVDNEGIKVLVFKGKNINDKELIDVIKKISNILDIKPIINDNDLRKYFYFLNKDTIDIRVSDELKEKLDKRLISKDEFIKEKYKLIKDSELSNIDKKECYIYKLITTGYSFEDKIIKVNISDSELTLINELNIDYLSIQIKWMRKYNYDTSLNQLFGNVGSIPKERLKEYLDKGYDINDNVGVSFLEEYYEDYLKGEKSKYIINNGSKEIIAEELRGNDLVLSIDIEIQLKIEEELKKEVINAKKRSASKYYNGSYIIVSNPNDGNIVAISGYKYNDGIFSYDTIGILTNSYTVGSVVKGASHTVAYKYGVLDENTLMADSCVKLYSQKEKCSWKSLGKLNDIDALAYSSNYFQFINAIKVSGYNYKRNMKFNPTKDDFLKYRDIFDAYGLGVKSNIDLNEESLGIKGNIYSGDLLLNLSIGQYDTYTPLMLNSYINTIASSGFRYRLSLGKGIIFNNGSYKELNDNKLLNKIELNNKYMERIREGFHNVVLKGTARSYFNYKYDGAGKTGTSETYFNSISTYTNTFVGFVPYDKPEYSITIVSPNIASLDDYEYKYPINSRLSKAINNILFEK